MKKIIITLFYPLWQLYKFLVLRPLYAVQDTWFVWRLRNHEAVALQKKAPIPLDTLSQKILTDLKTDGISITHIDDLFPNSSWREELTQYADACRTNAFQNKTKTYWTEMWDIKPFLFNLANPFVRLAIDTKIIGIANAYMGMYSRFHSVGLSEASPVELGTTAMQSQRWHRDIGNKKYLKAFLYLNDVEDVDGPFVYIKKSQPGGAWWSLFPQVNPYTSAVGRIEDSEVDTHIPANDILRCTGRAGTLIFADTTGIHKGGYSTRNPRLASIITYYSKASLEKRKYRGRIRYPEGFKEAIKDLPLPVRFAIEPRK